MSQMLKSSGALASATLTSRILGMVREIVYARFMGDGPVASAFKLAFQIPNLFRRLLGEGALSAVFMGMLNARGHFFIPAAGAVVLNLVMIAAVLFLAPRLGRELDRQIFGLAIGVLVAGVAQAAFQLPALRREGFRYQWVAPWRDATVREVVRKMIPGALGVAAFQVNVLLTNGLAFWVDRQIVASFDYAVR